MVRNVSVCSLLLAIALAPLSAAESVDEFRLGVSVMPGPYIHEEVSAGGSSGSYDWGYDQYPGSLGIRAEIGWWHTQAHVSMSDWSWLWMAGLNISTTDITPDSYEQNSGSTTNARDDLKVRFRQYGGALGLGLASAPEMTEIGEFHWELIPIIRGGWGSAGSTSPGVRPVISTGHSRWWEASFELGTVWVNEGWLLNPFVSVNYGKFLANIEYPNNGTSSMVITTFAPSLGLRVGTSF